MKMPARNVIRLIGCSALSVAATSAPTSAMAAADAKDPLQFFVLDRLAHDDNLFRAPESVTQANGRSADDYINRVSAGANVYLDWSRQVLRADVRIDDVSYQDNDDLDYTGGKANVAWDWEVGQRWSGMLSAQYERAQASFANYQFFGRDLVESSLYDGEVRYLIGTHWRLVAAAGTMKTEHGSADRQAENFDADTGRGSIEYHAAGGSIVALDYRNVQADFSDASAGSGISAGYEDSVPGVRFLYAFSEITSLFVRGGYLERTYDNPAAGDYSGEIWDAMLRWEPRKSLLVELKGWRALRAYSDAESDYFVASGGSLGPTWKPTPKWEVSALVAIEGQSYIGVGKPLLVDRERKDDVQWAELGVEYTPRPIVSIGLLYRYTERDSNRDLRDYDNSFVSMQVRINL